MDQYPPANKNIKTILRKSVITYKDWAERLPFALWGYRTSIRSSTGATAQSLVYGMEAVLQVEMEVGSLRIMMESQVSKAEWAKDRYEQLSLIDKRRLKILIRCFVEVHFPNRHSLYCQNIFVWKLIIEICPLYQMPCTMFRYYSPFCSLPHDILIRNLPVLLTTVISSHSIWPFQTSILWGPCGPLPFTSLCRDMIISED